MEDSKKKTIRFEDYPKNECVFCVFTAKESGELAVLILPEFVIPRGVYDAGEDIVETMINNVMMPQDPDTSPKALHEQLLQSGYRWSPGLAMFLDHAGDKPYRAGQPAVAPSSKQLQADSFLETDPKKLN